MELDDTGRRQLADDYRQLAIDETDASLVGLDADVVMIAGGAFVQARNGLWYRVYATPEGDA